MHHTLPYPSLIRQGMKLLEELTRATLQVKPRKRTVTKHNYTLECVLAAVCPNQLARSVYQVRKKDVTLCDPATDKPAPLKVACQHQ